MSAPGPRRVIGLDPGLRRTGWGVIETEGSHLRFIAAGVLAPPLDGSLAQRLAALFDMVSDVITAQAPDAAAVEETFVNRNPASTLRLGQARGVVLLAPARAGLPVAEYPPNLVKKAVVGAGHAGKEQVQMMVAALLPGWSMADGGADAADALAVAVTHAHIGATHDRVKQAVRA
ncbi:MAG: crossover junction endodeoxyribonuclease RuvC [Rhodospirillales bacterium]